MVRVFTFSLMLTFAHSGDLLASPKDWTGATDVQRFAVFESGEGEQGRPARARQLKRLQDGVKDGLAGFKSYARVAFRTEPGRLVAEQQELTYKADAAPLASGWRRQGELITWQGNASRAESLLVPLQLPGNRPLRLTGYDALWVDYQLSPGLNSCQPGVKLQVQSRPDGRASSLPFSERWSTGQVGAPKLLQTINANDEAWQKKEYSYLLGKALHFKPDSRWRYAQDERNVAVQRRMHVGVDAGGFLEIAIAPGWTVERVNLRVRLQDDYGPGQLVEFGGLPAPSILPDGRPGVRLYLREALQRSFPEAFATSRRALDARPMYLQEMVVFLPGDARQLAAAKPLRSVTLWGTDPADQSTINAETLSFEHQVLNHYSQRMVVDLRNATENGDETLEQATLLLTPGVDSDACAIRINGVRLVSGYGGIVPVYGREVEDWSRRWGGPFKQMLPRRGEVEQPGIIGYLPLESLTDSRPRREAAIGYVFEGATAPKETSAASPPYRIRTKSGHYVDSPRGLTNSTGVTLLAPGGMRAATDRPGVWLLDGDSPRLELKWPLNADIGPNTWFFMGAGENADQLGFVELILLTADGQRLRRKVAPNQPVHLVGKPTRLIGLELEIAPQVFPYRLGLRELALFEPSVIDYAKALRLPLPTRLDSTPQPVPAEGAASFVKTEPGRVVGLVGISGEVRFSTHLAFPLHSVRGLAMKFAFPPAFEEADGRCPLLLRFNWEKGAFQRQFCPNTRAGSVFVPLAAWIGTEAAVGDLGRLQSIDWTVSLPGMHARGDAESFSLEFSIDGWANLSAIDHLQRTPLFKVGKATVFAINDTGDHALGGETTSGVWLPLVADTLALIANSKGDVISGENALFKLDKIVVEPVHTMDRRHWERLVNLPLTAASSPWPQRLLWFSVLVLAWATARKGWWSPRGAWIQAKRFGCWSYVMMAQVGRHVGRWLWRMLPCANLGVAILALGPLLFWAGRNAGAYEGWMAMGLAILLVWGAYRHRWGGLQLADAAARLTFVNLERLLLVIALGNVVWSLGHFGLSRQALWGALPLLGAGYVLLPKIVHIGGRLETRFPGVAHGVGWSGAALILYGLGLTRAVGGENYFFTLGGMLVVLAMRAVFLSLKPWLSRRVPTVASYIFGGAGSLYFSSALVALIGTALWLSLKIEPVAEQLAVITYYCLVFGTAKEIVALRRAKHGPAAEKSQMQVEAETRA